MIGVIAFIPLLWVGTGRAQVRRLHFDHSWHGTRHDFVFAIAQRGRELWAAGSFGLMMRRDEGAWTHAIGTGPLSLLGLAFATDGAGVAVGQMGLTMEAAPGSDRWSRVKLPTRRRLFAVAAGPDGDFLVVGQFGALFYRAGERTGFRRLGTGYSRAAGPNLYQVRFLDAATAIAVGEDGTILTVKHGALAGSTSVGKQSLFALTQCGGLVVAAGQQGAMVASRDGANWARTQIDGAPDIFGLGCLRGGTLVASGSGFLLTATKARAQWKWRKIEPAGMLLPWLMPLEAEPGGTLLIGGPGGIFSAQMSDGHAR